MFCSSYQTQGHRESGGQLGHEALTLHRTQSHSHSHPTDNVEMTISLQHTSVDRGRKPGVTGVPPVSMQTHLNAWKHKQGGGRKRTPIPDGVRQPSPSA